MKQYLGKKKQKRCESISGRPYRCCYANGSNPHGIAECWYGDGELVYDADSVDFIHGTWQPKIRNGKRV